MPASWIEPSRLRDQMGRNARERFEAQRAEWEPNSADVSPLSHALLEAKEATAFFVRWDSSHGSGGMHHVAASYLQDKCLPLLDRPYPDRLARDLFRAAAALSRVVGWMTYDAGLPESAQRYLTLSLRLAGTSGDTALAALAFATLSDQARYGGDPCAALDFARAGQRSAGDAPDVLARCRLAEARAHALLVRGGDGSAIGACLHALHRAEQALLGGQRHFEYLPAIDEGKLATEQAHSCLDMSLSFGRQWAARAAAAADRGLELREASFVRGRALTKLTLARAHLRQGDLDRACSSGGEVLHDLQSLASAHSSGYVREFEHELMSFADHLEVRAFREQVRLLLAEEL